MNRSFGLKKIDNPKSVALISALHKPQSISLAHVEVLQIQLNCNLNIDVAMLAICQHILVVILYILLSGLPPFWGDNEEQIFKMVLKGHVDFGTDPWPKISSAAKDLVSQLLTMDAAKR